MPGRLIRCAIHGQPASREYATGAADAGQFESGPPFPISARSATNRPFRPPRTKRGPTTPIVARAWTGSSSMPIASISANIMFLSGFEPRFEEAFLLLGANGRRVLIAGNECESYAAFGEPARPDGAAQPDAQPDGAGPDA